MTPAPRLTRVGLALMAVQAMVLGAWATASPRGFYDTFPGGGRTWVSVDGPYNEHLLRDFGGLQLALGILAGVAAWKVGVVLVRTASVALLAFGIPHLAYHSFNLEPLPNTSDKVTSLVGLALAVTVPALILLGTWWPTDRRTGSDPNPVAGQATASRSITK